MLPYGIGDFVDLRNQNMYYADKSMYIPKMETTGNFLFLIRPRRFGKSVFLSMLATYYDIARQDKFDKLFEGLWIKEKVQQMTDGTELHLIRMQMRLTELLRIEEVEA